MLNWGGQYMPKIINGPYKAVNKKKCRIFVTTLLLILVLALVSILCARHTISSQEPDVYVVQKGDTLWTICKDIYGEMKDIREMVWRVRKINSIADPGELQPGMELYLPIAN